MDPLLIAVEGLDGAGKTTQVDKLYERLVHVGANAVPPFETVRFKFPVRETCTGKLITSMQKGEMGLFGLVRQSFASDAHALALQCIMVANRLEQAPAIQEHLKAGRTIVMDRYVDSGIVYGQADGLSAEWGMNINAFLPQPDLHILIDIDVDDSFTRRPERQHAFEADRKRMEAACEWFRAWWEAHGAGVAPARYQGAPTYGTTTDSRWFCVDGRQSVEKVHEDIWTAYTIRCMAVGDITKGIE